jgi:hypothetical protein
VSGLTPPVASSFLLGPRATGKSTWIQQHFGAALIYDLLDTSLALRLSREPGLQRGSAQYLSEVAPPVVRGLRWLAAAYAYLWLLTDELPGADGTGPVLLEIEAGGAPSAASALARLVRSLPALLLMILLSFAAGLLWIVAALFIAISEQVPVGLADFLAAALRYQFRLIAYHLSLVDRYPSYESPTTEASASSAA